MFPFVIPPRESASGSSRHAHYKERPTLTIPSPAHTPAFWPALSHCSTQHWFSGAGWLSSAALHERTVPGSTRRPVAAAWHCCQVRRGRRAPAASADSTSRHLPASTPAGELPGVWVTASIQEGKLHCVPLPWQSTRLSCVGTSGRLAETTGGGQLAGQHTDPFRPLQAEMGGSGAVTLGLRSG